MGDVSWVEKKRGGGREGGVRAMWEITNRVSHIVYNLPWAL